MGYVHVHSVWWSIEYLYILSPTINHQTEKHCDNCLLFSHHTILVLGVSISLQPDVIGGGGGEHLPLRMLIHVYTCIHVVHVHTHDPDTLVHIHLHVRQMKKRKKEASKVTQTTRQSNTAHPRQSLFLRKMSCLGWYSNPRHSTCIYSTCTCF